jgi:hypothetical protein
MNMTIQNTVNTNPTSTTTPTQGTQGTTQVPPTGSGITGTTTGNTGVPPQSRQSTPTTTTQTTGTPVNNPTQSQTRVNDSQGKLEDAIKLLNNLIKSLRDPDQLAALLIEMNDMQRQNALDQRLSSRDTAKSQLEGQAAEMREAAVKELASAAVAVVMSVVTFAVSLGGTLKMGSEIKDGAKAGQKAGEIGDKVSQFKDIAQKGGLSPEMTQKLTTKIESIEAGMKQFDNASNASFRTADKINLLTQAVSGLLRGMTEALEGNLRAAGKMDDAQGQVLAANAEDNKADADSIKSYMDAIDDLLKSALDFIQKLNDAEVEMMASASRL